ncbi:Mpv17 / PMP22 family protein [Nitzschia inconspicua]|uniref:Mpv17 / PMP22 family protein n=1 Tax=Nitzschia inconspicua TaxID=303405 RepID=A0A9K3PBW1_9STRA|nr:Mpv17 / PMP22 family protein [Nitzschia inconspicua]KAG7362932.1 Mpv17 / PMP22 family protein [Nitzschia inconspicua]
MSLLRKKNSPLWGLTLCLLFVVNSRMTVAWLTPQTTAVAPNVHSSNSKSDAGRPSRQVSAVTAASHRIKHTAPRRALEVMSDGDQQPPPLPRTNSSNSPSASSQLYDSNDSTAQNNNILSQLQLHQQEVQMQHDTELSVIQNHPVMKRLLGEDDDLSVQQKVINLLFLSAAFGYAIYTILNIDNGMTRGWTVQEQVMRIPLDNWGAYESYLANKPILTKTLINVIIYLLGDWLSQTAFQRKHILNFDISRTLRNGFIGLCFGPLVHQYYEFSDAILPPENGLVTRLEKIFMDQTIYLTVKCSIYISAVGLLAGEEWSTVRQTVKDKIVGVVFTAWKFWPIVHCITYSLIPAQHRILWVNCVDLVWNAILATQAQRKDSVFEQIDEEEAMGSATLSVFGEPLSAGNNAFNDTAPTILIIDDVSEDQFNSTSTSSAEALIV